MLYVLFIGCLSFENRHSIDADEDGFTIYEGDCNDKRPDLNPLDSDGDGVSTCDEQPDCDDGNPDTGVHAGSCVN